MPLLKGDIVEGRLRAAFGIDFSKCEGSSGRAASQGTTIKFKGSTECAYMGHYDDTYGGIMMRMPAMTNKETGGGAYGTRVLQISGYPTGTVEIDKGALNVLLSRASGYITSSWGGAPDTACRMQVDNSAAQTLSYGGMRGLYVYARQYSGGTMANIYGAEISTDDRGTAVGGGSCNDIRSLIVTQRCNSIVTTQSNVVWIECTSQGTLTPTTCTGTAMVKIRSSQPIASGARATAIHFETAGSGSGWTHAFSFQTNAGKEGFTAVTNKALAGNVDGYIKVYDVATGATLYINCYDAAPA